MGSYCGKKLEIEKSRLPRGNRVELYWLQSVLREQKWKSGKGLRKYFGSVEEVYKASQEVGSYL